MKEMKKRYEAQDTISYAALVNGIVGMEESEIKLIPSENAVEITYPDACSKDCKIIAEVLETLDLVLILDLDDDDDEDTEEVIAKKCAKLELELEQVRKEKDDYKNLWLGVVSERNNLKDQISALITLMEPLTK